MLLDIKLYPDPILKQKCKPLTLEEIQEEEKQEFFNSLYMTLLGNHGRGLAAPQVGKLWRVFYIFIEDEPTLYINPEILEFGGETILTKEQCLSIPWITGSLHRKRLVRVKYQNKEGEELERMLQGSDSIAFQHEYNHLEGITIFERMGTAQRTLKKGKYFKWLKKTKSLK